MKIALIQMEAVSIMNFKTTAVRIEDLIVQACSNNTDLDFVILPECAYPAYFLGLNESIFKKSIEDIPRVIENISKLAKRFRVYIVIGLPLPVDNDLYNAAIVFNREGKIINTTHKSNLWHFDKEWFIEGEPSPIFDTEFGKIGLMICADGRIPEIARILSLRGAKIIIDPVNLTASAASQELLSNQQYEFMLQTRARENGVYIIVCDKCGVENNLITALGRSFIVDPNGKILLECSPDKEEITVYDLDLNNSREVKERRPELYKTMLMDTNQLGIFSKINTSYNIQELALYTMVIRFQYNSIEEYINKSISYVKYGDLMGAEFIVLPELNGEYELDDTIVEIIQDNIKGNEVVAIAGYSNSKLERRRRAIFISGQAKLGEIGATHCAGLANDDEIKVVKLTPTCSISAVFDWEIEIPEITRTAMLKGADIILCYDNGTDELHEKIIKTRAAENKIFIIRSSNSTDPDCSLIINPDGGQVCTTLKMLEHSSTGYINTALSKFKDIVPGTNVVTSRIPNFYKELII